MCLPCIEPIINAWDRINPFKKARKRMSRKVEDETSKKDDNFDRDNVNITFIMEETRPTLTSDPGVSNNLLNAGPSKEVVLTMKKVSSLALV